MITRIAYYATEQQAIDQGRAILLERFPGCTIRIERFVNTFKTDAWQWHADGYYRNHLVYGLWVNHTPTQILTPYGVIELEPHTLYTHPPDTIHRGPRRAAASRILLRYAVKTADAPGSYTPPYWPGPAVL